MVQLPQSWCIIPDTTLRQNHRKTNLRTQAATQQWFAKCQVLCWVLSALYLSSSQQCCKVKSNTGPVLQMKKVTPVLFPQVSLPLEDPGVQFKASCVRGCLLISVLQWEEGELLKRAHKADTHDGIAGPIIFRNWLWLSCEHNLHLSQSK